VFRVQYPSFWLNYLPTITEHGALESILLNFFGRNLRIKPTYIIRSHLSMTYVRSVINALKSTTIEVPNAQMNT
jgi:hypothetical protein